MSSALELKNSAWIKGIAGSPFHFRVRRSRNPFLGPLPPGVPGSDPVTMVIGAQVTNLANVDGDDDLVFVNVDSGEVLAPSADAMDDPTGMSLASFGDDVNKIWALQAVSGSYGIRNQRNGLLLAVVGNSTAEDAACELTFDSDAWTCSSVRRWTISDVGNSEFSIVSDNSSRALSKDGSSLVQKTYTGADTQKWRIHHVIASDSETPDFSIVGWATQGGGTTGGGTAEWVTVTTPAELLDEWQKTGPRRVRVDGMLDFTNVDLSPWTGNNEWGTSFTSNSTRRVRPNGDLSTEGVGANSGIIGLEIRLGPGGGTTEDPREGNFIWRNLKFTCAGDLSPHANDPLSDSILIVHSRAGYVWVDHCEFTDHPDHFDPDVALDLHSGSKYITVSWCRFYDKYKACLWGSTTGAFNDPAAGQVTLHHTWFYGHDIRPGTSTRNSRRPRWGKGREAHFYNNLYTAGEGPESAQPSGQGEGDGLGGWEISGLEEHNYGGDGQISTTIYRRFYNPTDWGTWKIVQNAFKRGGQGASGNQLPIELADETGHSFTPPYDYELNHVLNVRAMVEAHSGCGNGPFAP